MFEVFNRKSLLVVFIVSLVCGPAVGEATKKCKNKPSGFWVSDKKIVVPKEGGGWEHTGICEKEGECCAGATIYLQVGPGYEKDVVETTIPRSGKCTIHTDNMGKITWTCLKGDGTKKRETKSLIVGRPSKS